MIKNPKVGIIGTGFMGSTHAQCYNFFDYEIGMIASKNIENAKANAKAYGAPKYTSNWRDVIENQDIDCIDITAPNFLHKDIALACIEAGKPFMIEKPLARNVREGEEIVNKAIAKGIVSVYGEDLCHSPAMNKAKEIIKDGGIGDILMFRCNEVHNGPFHAKWFWDADLTGGGAAIDMGIHGLYALEWISGFRVNKVYAETAVLKWEAYCKNGAEDTVFITLRFDNGAIAELVTSWAVSGGLDNRLELYGRNGTIYVNSIREANSLTVHSQKGFGEDMEVDAEIRPHVTSTIGWSTPEADEIGETGYTHEIKHFINCVKGKEKPKSTIEGGLRALELLEAVYKSAKTGLPIEV